MFTTQDVHCIYTCIHVHVYMYMCIYMTHSRVLYYTRCIYTCTCIYIHDSLQSTADFLVKYYEALKEFMTSSLYDDEDNPHHYSTFTYDAVWTMALALNNTENKLKSTCVEWECVYMYVYIHVHVYACECVCVCVCTCVYRNVCVYTCTCICM